MINYDVTGLHLTRRRAPTIRMTWSQGMTWRQRRKRRGWCSILTTPWRFWAPKTGATWARFVFLVCSLMFSNLFFLTIIPLLFNISLPTCLYNELFEPQRLSQFGRFLKLIVKGCLYYFFTFHLKLFSIMIIST